MKIYSRGIVVESDQDHLPASVHLLATKASPVQSGAPMALIDTLGRSLNERIDRVGQVGGAHRVSDCFEEADLRLLLQACSYHVARMTELYVERNRDFERSYDYQTTLRGNTSEPRVYYELSAFLSSARSWYDALMRLLWKRFDRGQPMPRHFTEFINKQKYRGMVPAPYERALLEGWSAWGQLLNEYRNSAVHRAPLNQPGTTCWIESLERRWALTVRIPADPTAQRSQFDFEGGRDALDYCHGSLCDLMDLADHTYALEEVRRPLDHPPRLK